MRVAYVVCALLISFEKKEITKIFQSKWISPCSCYYIKKERDMWCVRIFYIKTERIKVHTAEQVQQTNKKQKESENENSEGKKKMKQQL